MKVCVKPIAAAFALAALLVGCGAPPVASFDAYESASGIAPGRAFLQAMRPVPLSSNGQFSVVVPVGLYVSEARTNAVDILSGTRYKNIGVISEGTDKPEGAWVDQKGNLYVANYGARTASEYAGHEASPKCTYTKGLKDPINVTTDGSGNVYVADYDFGRAGGFVNEYAQCSNSPLATYVVGGSPEGAAVDKSGNLFVSYNAYGAGALEEFVAGSKTPTALRAPVEFAGGLTLDAGGNLLVCDQVQGMVDRIAPPYDSIGVQYSTFDAPFNVSLDKSQRLMFVTDPAAKDVEVLKYPSGIRLQTLGRKQGLKVPAGVAAGALR